MYRKFDVRDYQINRDDDYIFDKNGNFVKKIERKGPHRLGMPDKDGRLKYYEFADQVNDPKNIEANPNRAKAIPIGKDEMIEAIGKQGGISDYERYRSPLAMFWNSTGLLRDGKYDYTYNHLLPKYKKYIGKDIQNELFGLKGKKIMILDDRGADSVFFLPESDGYAHNTSNFGNFLWGATGRSLGYNEKTLHWAADKHSQYHPFYDDVDENGNRLPDSEDDKFSQSRGMRFADGLKLMNKEWSKKKGLQPKGDNSHHFQYIIP